MFSRLLIAYDGSPEAKAALAFAGRLHGSARTDVAVACILGDDGLPEHEDEARIWLAEAAAAASLGEDAELIVARSSRPAAALLAAAGRFDPDLILAGRCGESGPLARLGWGSVAHRLVVGASCSVALFSRGYEPAPAPAVLAGHDGSAPAEAAVRAADALAAALLARLVIVEVVDYRLPFMGDPTARIREPIREAAERTLHEIESRLHAPVDSVEARLLEGDARHGLLEAAEELRPLALLVGHRGSGGFGELVIGGTASRVAEGARCPVIVVRDAAPAEAPERPGPAS